MLRTSTQMLQPARSQPAKACACSRCGVSVRPVARSLKLQVHASYYQQGSNYPPQRGSQDPYQGAFYPKVPGYNPVEPSAPPLDPGTPTYPSSASDYNASEYASSVVMSEADQLAAEDLELMRAKAGQTRFLSEIAFWVQFALSITSAGILLFSSAFVPKAGGFSAADISKWMTVAGIAASFISALFAHGFLNLSKKLQEGGDVARGYVIGTLLTNNGICLGGIAITVIGLQASVGTLVAKSLSSAISGGYSYAPPQGGVVSLDVFALQASTNTLLCHIIGLLFTNLMLRLVNRK